jgi:hypothetical protein
MYFGQVKEFVCTPWKFICIIVTSHFLYVTYNLISRKWNQSTNLMNWKNYIYSIDFFFSSHNFIRKWFLLIFYSKHFAIYLTLFIRRMVWKPLPFTYALFLIFIAFTFIHICQTLLFCFHNSCFVSRHIIYTYLLF